MDRTPPLPWRTALDSRDHRTAMWPPILPEDLTTTMEKLVYAYLWLALRADVVQLSMALNVHQIRLYPVLAHLERSGHVERQGSTYVLRA